MWIFGVSQSGAGRWKIIWPDTTPDNLLSSVRNNYRPSAIVGSTKRIYQLSSSCPVGWEVLVLLFLVFIRCARPCSMVTSCHFSTCGGGEYADSKKWTHSFVFGRWSHFYALVSAQVIIYLLVFVCVFFFHQTTTTEMYYIVIMILFM